MLAIKPISEEVVKLWNGWEVRVMVLLSLFLQIILIIFGYRRKYTRRSWINLLVWSAYLIADLVATVALGCIARSQGDSKNNSLKSDNKLQAFWAPFLLLHLGGPDTITAYSLEDNELWLRHFLGLLVQVGVAFYVFIRSWNTTTAFTFIAIPMFITGIIKYGERTFVLRSSSAKQLKGSLRSSPDPGPDYVEILPFFPHSVRLQQTESTAVIGSSYDRPEGDYLSEAYFLFKRFKYLFAGLILGYYERRDSYSILYNKSAEEAFKLVAAELGFLYDVLYTKTTIIYSPFGIILRCICFVSYVSVLLVFLVISDKHAYPPIDISITYVLLLGAIALEAYAFIVLLFSDWTKLLFAKCDSSSANSCYSGLGLSNNKRWSGSMGQYNLLSFCLNDISTPFIGVQRLLGIKELLEKYRFLTRTDVNKDLQKMIFEQLLDSGNKIKDDLFTIKLCKELLAQRGDSVFNKWSCSDEFRWSTIEVEFDHSLLLWHIATDLCYYDDFGGIGDVNELPLRVRISTCISDYMLYLLVICPTMLPKGIGEIRYRDTCAEAIRLFQQQRSTISNDISEACKKILHVRTDYSLEKIKGDKSQSVLFYGSRLAKQLQLLQSRDEWANEQKWKMISEVWVEMLAYASSHCEWKEHGQQLTKGGELLTHICLLMAHLGLSEQYQIQTLQIQSDPSILFLPRL